MRLGHAIRGCDQHAPFAIGDNQGKRTFGGQLESDRLKRAMAPKRKQPTTSEQTDKRPSGTKAAKPGVPTVVYRVEYQLSGPYMQTERVTVGMYSTKALAVANSKAALDDLAPWGADWREEHFHADVDQFTDPPDSGQLYCFQSEGGNAETMQVTIESINLDTIDTPYTPRGMAHADYGSCGVF